MDGNSIYKKVEYSGTHSTAIVRKYVWVKYLWIKFCLNKVMKFSTKDIFAEQNFWTNLVPVTKMKFFLVLWKSRR